MISKVNSYVRHSTAMRWKIAVILNLAMRLETHMYGLVARVALCVDFLSKGGCFQANPPFESEFMECCTNECISFCLWLMKICNLRSSVGRKLWLAITDLLSLLVKTLYDWSKEDTKKSANCAAAAAKDTEDVASRSEKAKWGNSSEWCRIFSRKEER